MPLTVRLNKILIYARDEAERLQNTQILPEHLVLGILRLAEGQAFDLLRKAGLSAEEAKGNLDTALQQEQRDTIEPITRSVQVESIMRIAEGISREYRADAVGSAHLLLAILRHRINRAALYLANAWGITYEQIVEIYAQPHATTQSPSAGMGQGSDVEDSKPRRSQTNAGKVGTTTALDKYGHDLTKQAQAGKLDPVVGRAGEIERVVQILSRRKKNNPILIGEPGVGKSAIVEGLAQLIATRKTSPVLFGKRLVSLDMTAMVAGTKYRGQFEERIRALLKELEQNPDIIVFIDEIHTMIGAGNQQGSMDAASLRQEVIGWDTS